jgi:hypothetical protein
VGEVGVFSGTSGRFGHMETYFSFSHNPSIVAFDPGGKIGPISQNDQAILAGIGALIAYILICSETIVLHGWLC